LWTLDKLQASLPLLAAAGLAGFTWWLVQSSPRDGGPARTPKVLSEPDYVLERARVARFDASGRIVAVVDGDRMAHLPDRDVLLIDQVQLSVRDARGRGLIAQARHGEADPQAHQVWLQGQARVTAWPELGAGVAGSGLPAPLRFDGEELKVDTARRNLVSTRPVKFIRADSHIDGSALRYDHASGVTELDGRVHGAFSQVPR
jgi:lipopolysaccharide export system protein LptC